MRSLKQLHAVVTVDVANDPQAWSRLYPAEAQALVEIAKAAQAYRDAEAESDRTGEWEPAREAAVVLDAALARLDSPSASR